jgi:predicted Zn-dependent peptidase
LRVVYSFDLRNTGATSLPKNPAVPKSLKSAKSTSLLTKFDAKWNEWTMPNGLHCVHIPLPKGDPRFQMTLLIGTGSSHEPKELSGISHFLEHMMFRGSARYPSFSDLSVAFESLGGEWNAATGHEYTEFFFNGTSSKIGETVALFADFVIRPAMHDLETERRIVQRELEGEFNENDVSTDPDYHIATQIWANTPMAMPIIGTPETLAKISSADLLNWYKEHYTPTNAVLCLVGAKADESKKLLGAHFGAWQSDIKHKPHAPISVDFKGPHAFWVENSDNEYLIQMSFVCEGTGSPKTTAYELITRMLSDGFSSRLTRRIREELGLVYDLSAELHQYNGSGLLSINASVLGENLKPFFREVFLVLEKLASEPIPDEELKRHKHRVLTDLDITTSEPPALAWRGSWASLSKTEAKLAPWAEKFQHLDASFLGATASEVFQPKNLCVTALGPNEGHIKTELPKMILKWQPKAY